MAIPKNITKEHLIKAIEKIDKEGIPAGADSKYYDVIYQEKEYPPKLVVSYGNFFANGVELDRNSFEGGEDTPCFKLLKKHGFLIEKKANEFYPVLLQFLEQANKPSTNLKVSHYPKSYKAIKLKVSFGQGGRAEIPWMAFLREGQSVSKGIYPVFLYYSEYHVLILAYGVSETNGPDDKWSVKAEQVYHLLGNEYFKETKRYGDSLVFKHYRIDIQDENFGLKPNVINKDVNTILDVYKDMALKNQSKKIKAAPIIQKFSHKAFKQATDSANLQFTEQLLLRFIASLCTKPFLILTGLAGSGKTKLAQSFAQWICEDEKQYCIVPVGADWTNREPLLGYPNALKQEGYVKPENGAIDLILEALEPKNANKPYFLILDEMNLSHVERYFADFLSAMESNGKISLHSDKQKEKDNVPAEISLASNLFIIGTVNIDETTYMFSPKVLDRANVIEFRVSYQEMQTFLNNPAKANVERLIGEGATMSQDFLQIAKAVATDFKDMEEINSILLQFFEELKNVGAEFGYRTASEIYRLTKIFTDLDKSIETLTLIDIAVVQKLLPKLHGSRRKLESVLKTLMELCLENPNEVTKLLANQGLLDNSVKVKFPLSLDKISRMYKNVTQDGFTSFAEA